MRKIRSSDNDCLQAAAVASSSEPRRSIFAREFYSNAGLSDNRTTTSHSTNQKSAETSHDPISGPVALIVFFSSFFCYFVHIVALIQNGCHTKWLFIVLMCR